MLGYIDGEMFADGEHVAIYGPALMKEDKNMPTPNESIEVLKQPYNKDMNGHEPCRRCGKKGDDVLIIRQWHKTKWNHTIGDLILCEECRNELATALKGGEQE